MFSTLILQSILEAFGQISWVFFAKKLLGEKNDEKEEIRETVVLEESPKANKARAFTKSRSAKSLLFGSVAQLVRALH